MVQNSSWVMDMLIVTFLLEILKSALFAWFSHSRFLEHVEKASQRSVRKKQGLYNVKSAQSFT